VGRACLNLVLRDGSFVARPVVRLRRRSGSAPSSGLRVSRLRLSYAPAFAHPVYSRRLRQREARLSRRQSPLPGAR